MGKIVSLSNERVRRVQALQRGTRRRYQEGLFIAEGARLVQEAFAANVPIHEVFHTAAFAESTPGSALVTVCIERASSCWEVSAEVMQALADTETPQGILIVLSIPAFQCEIAAPLTLIPDAIRDPGNLGTMLRTAWAAGVQAVFLSPGCVDAFSPKVLRAGMGAQFHLAVERSAWDTIAGLGKHLTFYLAETEQAVSCWKADLREPLALIIGGEAEGAGSQARGLAQANLAIPMPGGSESLNAAVAAGILMFEVVRQRRG